MRGVEKLASGGELPPRARRIPDKITDEGPGTGTTSACAENTRFFTVWPVLIGNYLRVRGEYRRESH